MSERPKKAKKTKHRKRLSGGDTQITVPVSVAQMVIAVRVSVFARIELLLGLLAELLHKVIV